MEAVAHRIYLWSALETASGGATPLMLAVTHAKGRCMTSALLGRGASRATRDQSGETPITFCIKNNLSDCLSNLVGKAFRNERLFERNIVEAVNMVDPNKKTPLELAMRARNKKVVDQLVYAGASLVARDEYGYNALTRAASSPEHSDAIEWLIEGSRARTEAQKLADIEMLEGSGSTPLIVAITHKNFSAIASLVRIGAKFISEVRATLF